MLSIQEAVEKTKPQIIQVKNYLETHGYFDPNECNIYEGLKRSTQHELSETLRQCRLSDLLKGMNRKQLQCLKEFLPTAGGLSTGSLGTAGAQYLVPTWMSQKLYAASTGTDIVPLMSADIFEPSGGDCTVPTGILSSLEVGEGTVAHETVDSSAATIKLKKVTAPVVATNEMIEDNEFGLIEWHIQKAGEALGRTASDLALTVLKTATDGYGTKATEAAPADETLPEDIFAVMATMASIDPIIHPIANTMIVTPEAWRHSIAVDATAAYFVTGIQPRQPAQGFDLTFHNLDTKVYHSTSLGTGGSAGTALTDVVTLVFDRSQAMVTARKNWLRVENYANPVMDLAGAVISGRQDSVTVVDCAIGVVTEA